MVYLLIYFPADGHLVFQFGVSINKAVIHSFTFCVCVCVAMSTHSCWTYSQESTSGA